MKKTKIIALIACLFIVFFAISCIPEAEENENNETPTANETNQNESVPIEEIPLNESILNLTVSTNVSNEVNVTSNSTDINDSQNVSEEEEEDNTIETGNEDIDPEAHGGSGEVITETTPKEEIASNYTVEETLDITLQSLEEGFDWYKCKGSCIFECKSNSETFVVQDVEESGQCICKCSSGNEYLSKYFETTEVKVISSTENTVTVEYKNIG